MLYKRVLLISRLFVMLGFMLMTQVALWLPTLAASNLHQIGHLPSVVPQLVTCHLVVPPMPLTTESLQTPWLLLPPCHEANPAQSVFVQADIFDAAKGILSTYNPLVIDEGTTPAAPIVPLTLPAGATIGIWGGGNDDVTILQGPGKEACVNGVRGEHFGQVFFCGASHFFTVINNNDIAFPPLGVDKAGLPCPSTRSFSVVDQDPSDNVQTTYLALPDGKIAQDTLTNEKVLKGAQILRNGSDNTLLYYVDKTIGCIPMLIPDLTNRGNFVPTQATDELQAAEYQAPPRALVPAGDPMVGPNSLTLLNAYRAGVNQPEVDALGEASTVRYCAHLVESQLAFINAHRVELMNSIFPVSGTNLYMFMLSRYQASLQILGCHVV